MHILDNIEKQKTIDQGKSYESIAMLPDQCQTAWDDIEEFQVPDQYKHARSVLFAAMGGSAYGGRLIKSVFFNEMTVPVDIVSDYKLPGYADEKTLIVAASYSGSTEETISCINDAFRFDPMLLGITSGGEMRDLLRRHLRPVYVFQPEHNPSMQPRLGQGYMQMGQIALMRKLGFLEFPSYVAKTTIDLLKTNTAKLSQETALQENLAKQIAVACEHKIVNMIGAGHLEGAIHSIRNPFNETGKHFANYFIVPELNHHLMEGLMFPESLKKTMLFLLIDSHLYPERIRRRMQLTKHVVEQNGIETMSIQLTGATHMAQAFELIQLGSFVTFYMAMIHGVDPAKIPWVDYFKDQLKQK